MIYFAYDGTIHGDWVSHYAVRLAGNHPKRELTLLYVDEGRVAPRQLDAGLEYIQAACEEQSVDVRVNRLSATRTVLDVLASQLTEGPESYVVCGTRSRQSKLGILTGTVSQRLLQSGRFHVLAIRVNQPGLLGLPRHLLMPVAGHPRGFRSGLPFLGMFGPDITRMHVLLVRQVSPRRFRMLSHQAAEQLRLSGHEYCQRIEDEISEQTGLGDAMMDANVVVSDDPAKEIVIAANKTKSGLIYTGASERSLRQRLLLGSPLERVLHQATCDVAIYRGVP